MIVFIHEDNSYGHWVTHHRHGFVLDGTRKPKLGHLTLHRADCEQLRAAMKRGRATTGRRFKACSLDREELRAWAVEETEAEPAECAACTPTDEAAVNDAEPQHLTRFARDVLDYVLDVAVIHLEPDAAPYQLTVDDIAQCLRKTPQQLSGALEQLLAAEMIRLDGTARASALAKQSVTPTAKALQTLPAFAELSEADVAAELASLTTE